MPMLVATAAPQLHTPPNFESFSPTTPHSSCVTTTLTSVTVQLPQFNVTDDSKPISLTILGPNAKLSYNTTKALLTQIRDPASYIAGYTLTSTTTPSSTTPSLTILHLFINTPKASLLLPLDLLSLSPNPAANKVTPSPLSDEPTAKVALNSPIAADATSNTTCVFTLETTNTDLQQTSYQLVATTLSSDLTAPAPAPVIIKKLMRYPASHYHCPTTHSSTPFAKSFSSPRPIALKVANDDASSTLTVLVNQFKKVSVLAYSQTAAGLKLTSESTLVCDDATSPATAIALCPYNNDVTVGHKNGKIRIFKDYLATKPPGTPVPPPLVLHWHALPVVTLLYPPSHQPFLLSGGHENVLITWNIGSASGSAGSAPVQTNPRIIPSGGGGIADLLLTASDKIIQVVGSEGSNVGVSIPEFRITEVKGGISKGFGGEFGVRKVAMKVTNSTKDSSSSAKDSPNTHPATTHPATTHPAISSSSAAPGQFTVCNVASHPGKVLTVGVSSAVGVGGGIINNVNTIAKFNRISRQNISNDPNPVPWVETFVRSKNFYGVVESQASEGQRVRFYNEKATGGGVTLQDSVGDGRVDAIIPTPHSMSKPVEHLALHAFDTDVAVAATVSLDEFIIYDRRENEWAVRFRVARPAQKYLSQNEKGAATCEFSTDGSLLVTSFDQVVYVWDWDHCTLLNTFVQEGVVQGCEFLEDGRVVTFDRGGVMVTDLVGDQSWSLRSPKEAVVKACVVDEALYVAFERRIISVELDSGKLVDTFAVPSSSSDVSSVVRNWGRRGAIAVAAGGEVYEVGGAEREEEEEEEEEELGARKKAWNEQAPKLPIGKVEGVRAGGNAAVEGVMKRKREAELEGGNISDVTNEKLPKISDFFQAFVKARLTL